MRGLIGIRPPATNWPRRHAQPIGSTDATGSLIHSPALRESAPVKILNGTQNRRGRALRALLTLFLLLLVASGAVGAGCGSLGKDEVRDRTLALPKNARFAERMRSLSAGDRQETLYAAHFPRDLAVAAAGEERAPIVLVHGTPDGMGAWSALLFGDGALAGKENIWAIEVVGHGIAPANAGPYPFQRCADFVADSIEALGLEGVTLVGNSYGAEFCWRAAVDRPDLIGKLVLIDSSGLPRTDDQFLSEEVKMREWSVARIGYLANSEPRVGSALDPHFDGKADPGRVHEVFLGLENRGNWNAMIDLVRDENGEREHELASLQMPTLLIWGEHDEAYPPQTFGRTFEERIPDARLVVVEGAGHYPHEQRPKRVADELLAFHRGGAHGGQAPEDPAPKEGAAEPADGR